ncbi:MAG: hypothetical protein MGF17_13840 [Trichodesmium sp. MAG_R04]|nr:hypothetical protein [Trichodesmium sp. MAG_R04]
MRYRLERSQESSYDLQSYLNSTKAITFTAFGRMIPHTAKTKQKQQ